MVEFLGPARTRAESDAMIERGAAELEAEGWGPWAVEVRDGPRFAGMVGLHRVDASLPCAPAVEILWRLHPDHWGHGYATEAAAASLHHGLTAGALAEVVAFTTTTNVRSQAVMVRIGMVHDPAGDFDHPHVPPGSPLRPHVLYRAGAAHLPPTLRGT